MLLVARCVVLLLSSQKTRHRVTFILLRPETVDPSIRNKGYRILFIVLGFTFAWLFLSYFSHRPFEKWNVNTAPNVFFFRAKWEKFELLFLPPPLPKVMARPCQQLDTLKRLLLNGKKPADPTNVGKFSNSCVTYVTAAKTRTGSLL